MGNENERTNKEATSTIETAKEVKKRRSPM